MPLVKQRCAQNVEIDEETRFWGKMNQAGQPGISVGQHCRCVGEVARLLASFLRYRKWAPVLAALHDVGKICLGFAAKCSEWLQSHGLSFHHALGYETDHAMVGQWTVQERLGRHSPLRHWAIPVGAHHGRILGTDMFPPADGGKSFTVARERILDTLIEEFGPLPDEPPEMIMPGVPGPDLWALSGLITVADWIASDERFFPNDRELPRAEIRKRAYRAVVSLGFLVNRRPKLVGFKKMFGFDPNGIQETTLQSEIRPGSLVLVEATMGSGKTEAALALCHKTLCAGQADGLYFALPTRATTNQMHLRVGEWLHRIGMAHVHTHLIHSSAWSHSARTSNVKDWFGSSKRAILAPFGVGTVDQALMAILATKHFGLRLYGLTGKVVVLDEVHSCDLYTGTLVEKLIETLRQLGTTVVLLSATLSSRRVQMLTGAAQLSDEFPAVTVVDPTGRVVRRRVTEHRPPQKVKIVRSSKNAAVEAAIEAAERGACVLWICNTVRSAQQTYRELCATSDDGSGPKIGLLHSRFPPFRRLELEGEWISALGKDGRRPKNGCILVATQVVEQSVDIDADILMTESGPTDMILQRIGRLWRHLFLTRPATCREPVMYLIEPESPDLLAELSAQEIRKAFGSSSLIYEPYILLKSWQVWRDRTSVRIPDDIRELVDSTYAKVSHEPASWRQLRECMNERNIKLRDRAISNTHVLSMSALPDTTTRDSDIPMCDVLLAITRHRGDYSDLTLLNGDRIRIPAGHFCRNTLQAIQQNTVSVPRYFFSSCPEAPDMLQPYFPGIICFLQTDGDLHISDDRMATNVRYSPDVGIRQFIKEETNECGDRPLDSGDHQKRHSDES